MSNKRDMRRADLVVPYAEPRKEQEGPDMTSTMSTTLPMMAIFTRNRLLGWSAVLFSVQSWLAETPDQRKNATTPGYFSVGMALMSLMVGYMPYFMPPPPGRAGPGTGTDAPSPQPPS